MRHLVRKAVPLLVVLLAAGQIAQAAMERRARRFNVLDLYGGYAKATGRYDGIGGLTFRDSQGRVVELDADQVYDPSWHLGLNYGSLRGGHILAAVGFHYSYMKDLNRYTARDQTWALEPSPTFQQYDLNVEVDYLVTDISRAPVAPFVGFGLRAGFNSQSADGVESETRATIAATAIFGLEVRLFSFKKGRGFVTLASRNSWDFLASGDRPKFLDIGAGLKYYFRM